MPSPFKFRQRLRRALVGRKADEKYPTVLHLPLPKAKQPTPPPATFTLYDLSNLVLYPPYTKHIETCSNGHYKYLLSEEVKKIVEGVRARTNKVIEPDDCMNIGFLRLCVALVIAVRHVPYNVAGDMLRELLEVLAQDEYDAGKPGPYSKNRTWVQVFYSLQTADEADTDWGNIEQQWN
ncbi:hypothetical protein BDD12DRAFT_807127 [Trichophaea hybrida]|nr:hypothetical protein BDD12DRAFT_807127 [Trichophaea hybrida]